MVLTMRITHLVTIVAVALGAAARLAAADDRKLAESHARRGVALYNLGKYDAAISEFEAAYTLYQSDALLFDLGQAHRQLDHCEPALHYYQRFLAGRPAPELAADVRRLLPKLEAACAAKNERPDGPEADAAVGVDDGTDDARATGTLGPPPVVGLLDGTSRAGDRPPVVAVVDPSGATTGSDDATDEPVPPQVPTQPGGIGLTFAATGGTFIGDGAAPSAGLLAAIAVPRRWGGADVAVGASLDVRAVPWSNGFESGVTAAASVAVELARRWTRGPVVMEVGGGAGALYLSGLGRRGNPFATSRASDSQVLPGGRASLAFSRPIGKSSVELWTCARLGVWPALGSVAGSVLVEVDGIVGIRVRR